MIFIDIRTTFTVIVDYSYVFLLYILIYSYIDSNFLDLIILICIDSLRFLFVTSSLSLIYTSHLLAICHIILFLSQPSVNIEALAFIFSFPPNKFLIVLNSISCIQCLNFNRFNSHLSPSDLRIRPIIFCLRQSDFNIQLSWASNQVGIQGRGIPVT